MELVKINNDERIEEISSWFAEKWSVSKEVYRESILESLANNTTPSWYLAFENDEIIAGAGVIENDFHERKDLSPNICALYVEKNYRNNNIAKNLLDYILDDYKNKGIDRLYLITDHEEFYERCNWKFIGMVKNDEGSMDRMYSNKA